jgi:hypothetical protein
MNYQQKKKLVERTKNLADYEYCQLFEIIKKDAKSKYSQNKNGVFVNLKNLSQETLEELDRYLNFIENKKKDLQQSDEHKEGLLNSETNYQKMQYENVYHESYQDLSNYQKSLIKKQCQYTSLHMEKKDTKNKE